MSAADEQIDAIMNAHAAVADAEREVSERVAYRAHLVRQALDSGVGAQPIADALGVARPRVYRLANPGNR
ncbi:hypothetical protein [Nesterenkonia sp. K-15-9-6]|uniref:hypothetical protein n=1 Tax=Nesterenkonia sp. K-15-9-6 TaxID=3093918 RepID=UPI0040443F37